MLNFRMTVRLPLRAIVCGYSLKVIWITWRNLRHGLADFAIMEMGSVCLLTCLYVWKRKES
jgi:hypothetical protein